MTDNNLLRSIPKVDELMRSPLLINRECSHDTLTGCVREVLDGLRSAILSGNGNALPSQEELCANVLELLRKRELMHLRPVINATGVVLHTNLGRAPMAEEAAKAACDAALAYSTLEYDLDSGSRGSRYSHVEPLLAQLCGTEAAMVVNNNAAAVLLILSALGKGKEAIVSRGELVEIGGSFRVPDIMESCGCILREVGTTNKTHLADYERAIGENTFGIVKVHTSNFRVVGFTESPSLAQLAELAHSRELPLIEDLGSGALCDPESFGVRDEPFVLSSIRDGADVVSFSGDKLLGGPQAGIIVGKKKYIDIFKKHPLTRAMRVDKMTLAALEATLRIYASGESLEKIPTLSMLCQSSECLKDKAIRLEKLVKAQGIDCETIAITGQVGGGSAPTVALDSFALAISDCRLSPNALEQALRIAEQPIVGRIVDRRYCLDVRTVFDKDLEVIARRLMEVLL